jgi:predicted  nucleic acid-binding Zn-ribbon protein
MSPTIKVSCPHCSSLLTIDTDAGVITGHEPPVDARAKIDFDQRLKQMKDEQERAADRLQEAMRREESRDRLMEDKFRELMDKAKDMDNSRPVRDIDLD